MLSWLRNLNAPDWIKANHLGSNIAYGKFQYFVANPFNYSHKIIGFNKIGQNGVKERQKTKCGT